MCELVLSDSSSLRLLQESDVDELHAVIVANRDYLARRLPWAASQTFEDTQVFIRRTRQQLAGNDGFQTAVVEDREIVGMIGFTGISWQHRSTTIGYWLAESAQGRGIMTRAVRMLVDHAIGTWQLNRIEIRAEIDNTRSRAIAERLGFNQEGVSRDAERIGDRYLDQAMYAMLAREWLAHEYKMS